MPEPLSSLSPAKQNSRSSPVKLQFPHKQEFDLSTDYIKSPTTMTSVAFAQTSSIEPIDIHPSDLTMDRPSSPSAPPSQSTSPRKAFSPIKYRLQDDRNGTDSPPGSPAEATLRFNEGLTQAIENMQNATHTDSLDDSILHHSPSSSLTPSPERDSTTHNIEGDDLDDLTVTLNLDDKSIHDETVGDLSTISAIPTDMTRFANWRNSPSKPPGPETWSPSKQLRTSIIASTPTTGQRPLRLLSSSRHSTSSNEDDDATPRRPRNSNDSPTDLMNFTTQSNIVIPPPSSAPRTMRRSPSGRGHFPSRSTLALLTGRKRLSIGKGPLVVHLRSSTKRYSTRGRYLQPLRANATVCTVHLLA